MKNTFDHEYTVDFSDVKYYPEMHRVIKECLHFPWYYGENWDAFWDCITDMITIDVHIKIIGLEVLTERFPGEDEMLLECLADFKHYADGKYADRSLIEVIGREGNVTVIE